MRSLLLILFVTSILINNDFVFAKEKESEFSLLSSTSIFRPLIADPKWPRFSLAYQYHPKGTFGHHIFAPNFGAVLPLIRNNTKNDILYELSVHAGLFATMDISSNPTRLINADYVGGGALAIRDWALDYLLRVIHTSSHLGDEFLLSDQGKNITRVNLSYETAEAIIAYRFANNLRPYIGVGYIVHAEPSNFKSLECAFGIDYRSKEAIFNGYGKPILGFHTKTSKNYKWRPNISVKAGLSLEDKFVMSKDLELLLEYYNGYSLHGQFFNKKESYIGTSLSVNF